MNFGQLQTEVQLLLQDWSDDIVSRIPGAINEALAFAAGEVDIPSLKFVTSVDTVVDQAWASMPVTSAGKLLYVSYGGNTEVDIMPSLTDLLVDSPGLDETGDVEQVALEGNVLWYRKIPETATTLLTLFYKKPTELSASGDTPDILPDHLHRHLLIHGAARILYEDIEDGLDDNEKVNTIHHTTMTEIGIQKLREWIGKNRPAMTRNPYHV